MREGLYRVHFQTPAAWGAGVVHVLGGKLWGGDAGLYYVGTYRSEGDNITAEITTNRHTNHPGIASVFGRDQVRITLTGVTTENGAKLNGKAAEVPGAAFSAELTRIAD